MKLAFSSCCTAGIFVAQYQTATTAVLGKLGIDTEECKDFNCCGFPIKGFNYMGYILLAARNLALSEKRGADLLTACGCCFGSLKHVESLVRQNESLKQEVNSALSSEGLSYAGNTQVKHVLDVVLEEVGIENLKNRLEQRFSGARIATHYGCRLLRPRELNEFDSPFKPVRLDQVVEATGAESIEWRDKLECCGASLTGVNDTVSLELSRRKLAGAKEAKADYICSACPHCHIQFIRARKTLLEEQGLDFPAQFLTFPQLLGLCLGLDEKELGIGENSSDGLKAPHFAPGAVETPAAQMR